LAFDFIWYLVIDFDFVFIFIFHSISSPKFIPFNNTPSLLRKDMSGVAVVGNDVGEAGRVCKNEKGPVDPDNATLFDLYSHTLFSPRKYDQSLGKGTCDIPCNDGFQLRCFFRRRTRPAF
jgi:hypothetical protein